MIEFRMPNMGADMEAGTLREWLVKPGDDVKRGDIIAVVETQKGLIEIEIFEEGIIHSLLIKVEDKVPVDTVMALLTPLGKESEKPIEIKKEIQPVKANEPEKTINEVHIHPSFKASPLAKRIAEEYKIDLNQIKGTGENGAITKDDVQKVINEKKPETYVKAASDSTEPMRMAIAAAMSKSNREIPHYYLETKVDMSKALSWLAETNNQLPVKDRLLPIVMLIKAVAKSLIDVPDLNGIWENGLQRKNDIHIGFVISIRGGGLMIPAIHHADKKSLVEIMQTLNDIIPRARNLKLRSSELSDSTITLSNLGEGGADKVYGVIYPPQVAIIGFGSITEQPWADSGMLDVRPVVTVTLAGDHRATDGHTGSRFLVALKNYLQKPGDL